MARTLENRLADFGVEAISTVDRLRAYQQVENTYLSTFQALGALGLVLGTFGVGTVLLRNILERRRELALLQAIGYRESHIRSLILAESVSLVVWGLLAGAACALLAVLPAIVERGGSFPWTAVVDAPGRRARRRFHFIDRGDRDGHPPAVAGVAARGIAR